MSQFTSVMNIVQSAIKAFGIVWVVWGAVILGTGLKDKTAPDIKQGFGQVVGGVVIYLAAGLLSGINISGTAIFTTFLMNLL